MQQSNGQKRYNRIGLTGGIGAGKSTVSARFAALGASVLDADALSRGALALHGPCYDAAIASFGQGIVCPDGEIDRSALAAIVFADEGERQRLNGIIHPFVLRSMQGSCETILARDPRAVVIFDIPLLIECGAYRDMDRNIVVIADAETRVARICRRSGMEEQEARARIRAQISQQEQLAHADIVIDNSGGFSSLYAQVDRIYSELWEENHR